MVRMRAASSPIRFAWAAAFALLLALRLLGSSGFMPEVARGTLSLVACPDADISAPLALGMPEHRHGTGKHQHDVCPYAAAAAVGAVPNDLAPLLSGALFFAVALLTGRGFLFVERQARRERPPAIGPPIPA